MNSSRWPVNVLVLSLCIGALAWAQAPPPRNPAEPAVSKPASSGKYLAVVIGINVYQDKTLQTLKYAVNDAKDVGRKLKEDFGFKITPLIDGEATKQGILTTLNNLRREAQGADNILIFFAGHGKNDNNAPAGKEVGYLLPTNGDSTQLLPTAIAMDELRRLSEAIPAKNLLYIFDACFSGLAIHEQLSSPTTAFTRQVITAGNSSQQVVEEGGHGLFTQQLLEALNGPADFNCDGVIDSRELGIFLELTVPRVTDGQQTPLRGWWSWGEAHFTFPRRKSQGNTSQCSPAQRMVQALEPPGARSPGQRQTRTSSSAPEGVPQRVEGPERPGTQRVMIMIPEVLHNTPVLHHPAGEAEVMRQFLQAGYEVVDQAQVDEMRNPQDVRRFLAAGKIGPAKTLGERYGVDWLVIGEGVSELIGKKPGTNRISSEARFQAKVINIHNGQLVAVVSPPSVGGWGLGEMNAGKEALTRSASLLAEELLRALKN